MHMSYWRFAAMIATGTVVMFGLMYLNTYALDHVFWSETRTWMALMMGATMAVIMLAFMLSMYRDRAVNIGIFVGSAVVFALTLWLVRSQSTVSDSDYMKAMIPHHSIAVLTSERAQISDPRVRKLADEIIAAQRREIAEMRYLIRAIEQGGEAETTVGSPPPPMLVPALEAIHSADVFSADLAEMDAAEVSRALGAGPYCLFYYSRSAGPVMAALAPEAGGSAKGVVKLHGRLVALDVEPTGGREGLHLLADGIELSVTPRSRDQRVKTGGVGVVEAEAELRLDAGLHAGYDGYYGCGTPGDDVTKPA